MEIGHIVLAAGLEINKQRRLAADLINCIQCNSSRHLGMAPNDSHEMHSDVRRASDSLENGDAVEEGLPREKGLGSHLIVVLQRGHGVFSGGFGDAQSSRGNGGC